ncbi:MAG: Gfo/Idh/MocA family oxidoreductase [Pseudomonadota bacterium]
MERIGLGLIGSGFMGMAHAFGFAIAERVFDLPYKLDFAVMADATDALAKTAQERFGFRESTGDWRALVADPSVHMVAITTPNALHKEIALAAIAAGKHVYCEKPLGLTSEETEEMAHAAAAAGVVTQVGFNYICNPMVVLARHMIRSGELGDIVNYRGVHAEGYMLDPATGWNFRFEPLGGGVLADLGSHALATAEFLLGPIDEVFGDCRTVYPTRLSRDGTPVPVKVDDITCAQLRFARGCGGSMEASWLAAGEPMGHTFHVYGTKGAISFTQERLNELRHYSCADPEGRHGFRTILAGTEHPPYGDFCVASGHQLGFNDIKAIEVKGFLDAIAGRQAEPMGFGWGHRIQVLTDTIRASSRAKAWTNVPPTAFRPK